VEQHAFWSFSFNLKRADWTLQFAPFPLMLAVLGTLSLAIVLTTNWMYPSLAQLVTWLRPDITLWYAILTGVIGSGMGLLH
jgi:hypothetical protein